MKSVILLQERVKRSGGRLDADDLEEMDLKWQMAMLTMRARSVMVLEAMIGAFRQKTHQPTMPPWPSPPLVLPVLIMRKSQFDVLSYKTGLESVEARIIVYQQKETIFEEDIKFLKLDVQLRDIALVELRKKFEKAEQERDELKLKLDKFQTSSKNLKDESKGEPMPTQKAPSFVQTSEHVKTPRPSVKPVEHPILAENLRKYIPKSRGHRNSRNRKACFVCKSLTYLIKDCDYYEKKMFQMPVRNHAMRGHHQHYTRMTHPNPHRHVVPTLVLTRSRLVPLTTARPVTTDVPLINVTRPRPAKTIVTKPHSPLRRPINHRPSPNPRYMSYLFDFKEINGRYVAFGRNPKGVKITRKGKIRTGKLDFDDVYFVKELKFNLFSVSQMCDKKNNVLFIDTECIVLSSDFKLPDENHHPRPLRWKADVGFLVGYSISSKAFRVFNSRTIIVQETLHINFLENQPYVVGSGPTWLFDIDTLSKSINYQPVLTGNQPNSSAGIQEHFNADKSGEKNVQKYVLFPLWSSGSKDPQNTDDDTTFEVKEPESEVHVSPSSSDKTKKHDDKTKREAKGKSPIKLLTGVRNLSEEFEDFSDNSINKFNAASTPVHAVGQISTNITNTFSVANLSNTAVSPTLRKSSYVDPSQYPDDPDMPALEDITYSDDEKDVGVEADFSNLETNITASPIPTTKVHKDHLVIQIIGDLSLTTQTRSMTRMVKDQSGLTQINNEDFYTCMFACFLSQEEPKREEGIDYEELFASVARIEAIRLFLAYASFMGFMVYKVVKALYGLHQACRAWYETLANYLLKNGFQRGKIDQTLFIKKQKRKSTRTPIDTKKPLLKDPDGKDVNVHTYRLCFLGIGLTIQVNQSSMTLLERTLHGVNTPRCDEDRLEIMELLSKVTTAATTITVAPSAARRRKGVVIRDPEEIATPSIIVHFKPKSKDKGKGILVEEPKHLKKQAQIEQDKAYARELEAELNKNINWDDVIEQVKSFLEKSEKELEEKASKALNRKIESSGSEQLRSKSLMKSFGVDAVEDYKEYTLRDYYCWLKTYCCWYKLKLLDNAADSRLRLLEESVAADDEIKK
nr:hypothetical protein [Tanacetum cinerariifolium]